MREAGKKNDILYLNLKGNPRSVTGTSVVPPVRDRPGFFELIMDRNSSCM